MSLAILSQSYAIFEPVQSLHLPVPPTSRIERYYAWVVILRRFGCSHGSAVPMGIPENMKVRRKGRARGSVDGTEVRVRKRKQECIQFKDLIGSVDLKNPLPNSESMETSLIWLAVLSPHPIL